MFKVSKKEQAPKEDLYHKQVLKPIGVQFEKSKFETVDNCKEAFKIHYKDFCVNYNPNYLEFASSDDQYHIL